MEYQEEDVTLIEELRKRLLSRGPELQEFDEKDIERVKKDDAYVWLFLKHKHNEMEKALELMVDCFKWRCQFEINGITERKINRHLFEVGFLYPRNKDKYGNPLLLFHMKKYKKVYFDIQQVKMLFSFALEKMSYQFPNKRITMIFDMQESGLSNKDMELIRFITTCFQSYFPSMLECLIVYETPWILTAAWKIVKGWMNNDGISKLKIVNKNDIGNYIAPDQLLTSMGGTDSYIYKYPPQMFSSSNASDNLPTTKDGPTKDNKADVFSSISVDNKSGHVTSSSNEHSFSECTPINVKSGGDLVDLNPETTLRKRERKKSRTRKKLENAGPLTTISPANELVFYGTKTSEMLQIITITNTVSSLIAFKIKTTTPGNFRVRPSCGPIPVGASVEVHIYLQQGFDSATILKDKFLILSTIVPVEQEKDDLNTMWKSISHSSIMEQRLRCRFDQSFTSESDHDSLASKLSDRGSDHYTMLNKHLKEFQYKMDDIQQHVSVLEKDIRFTFRLVLFLLVTTVLAALAFTLFPYLR